MHPTYDTLDDALLALYPQILAQGQVVEATRGRTRELIGVQLEVARPRARLSRTETRGKPFSALGEFLWYMSRDNKLDFITPYINRYQKESDDGLTVYGGYGPRLFRHRGQDQIANVVARLKEKQGSRRAVVQLFDADDLALRHKEIPCTTTLQFLIREGKLHLVAAMRSNDAVIGLPHDVFCFTMLQESICSTPGVFGHTGASTDCPCSVILMAS
jgi:thymidylate synthase